MSLNVSFALLGFRKSETKILDALFQHNPLLPSEIARKTGLSRVTVYDLLSRFLDAGLAVRSVLGKREVYTIGNPRLFKKFVEERKSEAAKQEESLNSMLPNLIERYETKSGKPSVFWHEGIKGIQEMLMLYVEENISGKVVGFSNTILVEQVFTPTFLRKFIAAKEKNEIKSAYIIAEPKNVNIDTYVKKYYRRVAVKIVPTIKKLPVGEKVFESEINIYDDKVSFIKIKPPTYFGVLIKSSELANSLRLVFESLWKRL